MKVWVTRAEPGASQTAARLRALGHEALTAPVLAVRPLPAILDLDDIGALAFTSGNGVRAFATLCPDRRLPVFTVGEATARAARDAGFVAVSSADGDVADLSALIASAQDRRSGAVLFVGAAEPAGDLIGALEAAGVCARSAAVYETRRLAVQAPPGAQAVLVHSPKAAVALASAPLEGWVAYCISLAAAEALAGSGARVVVAAEPNEARLLGLLESSATHFSRWERFYRSFPRRRETRLFIPRARFQKTPGSPPSRGRAADRPIPTPDVLGHDDQPQPLRLGRSFWTALILGLLCVIAGYAFARLAPALLARHAQEEAPAAPDLASSRPRSTRS
jgi:uroporphyrinogen-III synthase